MTDEINALVRAVEAKAASRMRHALQKIGLLLLVATIVGSLIGGLLAGAVAAVLP